MPFDHWIVRLPPEPRPLISRVDHVDRNRTGDGPLPGRTLTVLHDERVAVLDHGIRFARDLAVFGIDYTTTAVGEIGRSRSLSWRKSGSGEAARVGTVRVLKMRASF